MPSEIVVLDRKRDKKSDTDGAGMAHQLAPAAVKELEPVRKAVDNLRAGIVQRFNRPDYVTLAMHVNLNTAKADLIPVPHPENMTKLKDNFNRLPTKVQDVIRKNIPEEQMKAVEEIYSYLERRTDEENQMVKSKVQVIEETEG